MEHPTNSVTSLNIMLLVAAEIYVALNLGGFSIATPRFPSYHRRIPNCADKVLSITVSCRPELQRAHPQQANNRSSCCFFSALSNSSHLNKACVSSAEEDQGTMSTNAKTSGSAGPTDSNSYRLSTCEGWNVRLQCDSCGGDVRWRSFKGDVSNENLSIENVQREDGGAYTCEVADRYGKVRIKGTVRVEVQFAPVITVPNNSVSVTIETEDVLECQSEASPRPTITWYRDGAPLSSASSSYSNSEDCRTTSYIDFKAKNNASEDVVQENFTCVAENELGKAAATFLLTSFTEESPESAVGGTRRRFNVTGFIVGMLPPLLISFYIILKLGYRSRYAEERGEDDGFREEPFFISY